jgi:hypothetical protein
MNVNWQFIGHAIVGTVVTTCQAIALVDQEATVQSVCKVITLVVINLGVSLGVWQVSQVAAARRELAQHLATTKQVV